MPSPPSSRSYELTAADLEPLERGARLLGSGGGGGDPTVYALLARAAIGAGAVRVVDPAELPQDGLVIAAAMLGSPAITAELLPAGDEFTRAFRALEAHLGRRAVAVFALELAGVNVFPPLVVAAELGLPLLDVDGMGRAYPRLDHTVLHARGARCGPVVNVGVSGETVTVDVADAARAEALTRASLGPLGGWCGHAGYPLTVAEALRCGLRGTLARALALGHAAAGARDAAELAERCGARLLGRGRVLEVERADGATGARGSVLVDLLPARGATLRIELQAEYLLAALDGEVVAATPDVVTVVDGHTLVPISCEDVRRGNDVAVLHLPADPAWMEPAALALTGPAAFGYLVEP